MTRPPAIVFCERLDNESFCASIIRELGARFEVRPCGPGWPIERLGDVDPTGARFYLELDAASGSFVRPGGLERLELPKVAWLIDTHKKPMFHRELSRDMDLTFFAMQGWGHVLEGRAAWLPLHCDPTYFHPVEAEREWDVAFVGSQPWRADPLRRIASRHGLRLHVSTTTGRREKSDAAAVYARAKIVYNRHVTNDLNFRVFEAMACGRVLLTDAQHNGQYDLFEDDRHYVLYKDERDLERQVLRLLADDPLRARIEREAAGIALARHTTCARVAELCAHLDRLLPELEAPSSVSIAIEPPRRRWLVVAGDAPPTVERRSYAERLGHGLAERGDAVLIARPPGGPLGRGPGAGRPTTLDLAVGPLPVPPTRANQALALAAPLQARLDRVAREHGPFDAVLAEGPLGGLLAVPLCARLGLPFLLALTDCEVARRNNQLTREQLYWAELEQWSCERAQAVVVPHPALVAALAERYDCERATCVRAPAPALLAPAGGDRLLQRLGIERPPVVLLAHAEDRELATRIHDAEHPVIVLGAATHLVAPGEGPRLLARRPATGPALAAMLVASRAVLALDRHDVRLAEAAALRCSIAVVAEAERRAPWVAASRAGPVEASRQDDALALEALLTPIAGVQR